MNIRTTREGLAAELAALPGLDKDALKHRWRQLYGIDPPRNVRRNFLMHAIAYRLQENVLGGLKPATRRLLVQVAEEASVGRNHTSKKARSLKAGTRLLREWQGVTHEVTILDDGVLYRGEHHRSLSVVARIITGARWSGPLFFGLKKVEGKNHHGRP